MKIRAIACVLALVTTSTTVPTVFAMEEDPHVLIEVRLKENGKLRPSRLFLLPYGKESVRSSARGLRKEKEVIRVKVWEEEGRLKVDASFKRGAEFLFRPSIALLAGKTRAVTIEDTSAHRALTIKVKPLPGAPRVTFNFRNADISDLIDMITRVSGEKIIVDPEVKGQITISINNVPWLHVLKAVVKTLGFDLVMREDGALHVVSGK